MEKMKLKDLINIRTGKLDANASSENGKYPFFTCSKETLKINTYSYDCECVLLAGNGDLNVKYYNGKFDAYQRTYILECKNDIIYTKYLYYFMKKYLKILRNQSVGGVIKYIKLANITEAIIPIYSKEEQEKIANNISKVEEVLNIKNKQIEELQNFIKSQFVEMFGDIKIKEKVKNVSVYFSRGKTPNYVEKSNIKVISQACIYWDEFKYEKAKYQDENKVLKSLEKMIENGDVLITSTGTGTLGRCNVYYGEEHKYMADSHVSILRFNYKEVNPIFFKYYFMQEKVQKELYAECVNGSTNQIELSKDRFLNFRILIPEITLQNQFSEIVKQIDKQKFESMIQLKMMEKYFG